MPISKSGPYKRHKKPRAKPERIVVPRAQPDSPASTVRSVKSIGTSDTQRVYKIEHTQ